MRKSHRVGQGAKKERYKVKTEMALIKVILGFLLGILLCGVLLFLISVRSPMSTEQSSVKSETPLMVVKTDEVAEEPSKKNSDDGVAAAKPEEKAAPASIEDIVKEMAKSQDQVSESASVEPEVVEPATVEPDGDEPELAKPDVKDVVPEQPQTEVADQAPSTSGDAPQVETENTEAETRVPEATAAEDTQNADTAAKVDESAPKREEPKPEIAAIEPENNTEPQRPQVEDLPEKELAQETVQPASRLPTIGGNGGSRIKLSSEAEAQSADPTSFGAFELNSAQFAGNDLPLIAIILVDVGAEGVARNKLSELPFPATIAVPADQNGAAKAINLYRQSGKEVLLEAPSSAAMSLTSGVDADEQRALLEDLLNKLPGAVGLIDNPLAEMQKDRRLMKTVLETLSESGHAILSYKKGLSSTSREAAKLNVPSGEVFRVLDEDGIDKEQFNRVLKRAVIQARQDGGTILMAHSQQEALDILSEWVGSGGADGIEIAPVSAVVRRVSN